LVQDLFREGADQGLAPEWAAVVLFGALDDVVDVEGAFGGCEYVMYYLHIRRASWRGRRAFAFLGAAQGAQSAELGECRIF
jgi:hypothetical protein